jgi:hypothetical protein
MDQRKYTQYVKLRQERDKFLKNLKPGWYEEWMIHKKLLEAGGLGDTVYILPARGGGISFRKLKEINDLIDDGRDVRPATLKTYEWPKLSEKDILSIREAIQDFTVYSELINPWKEPEYRKMFRDFYPTEEFAFDPCYTIDPDGRIRIKEISLIRKEEVKEERV